MTNQNPGQGGQQGGQGGQGGHTPRWPGRTGRSARRRTAEARRAEARPAAAGTWTPRWPARWRSRRTAESALGLHPCEVLIPRFAGGFFSRAGGLSNHHSGATEAGCESLRAIAAGLEQRGIPAARWGKWSAVQVAHCWRPLSSFSTQALGSFNKRRVRRRVKHPHAVLASNDPQAIVLDVMQPAGAVVAEIIPRSGFIERRAPRSPSQSHSAGTAGRFMRYFGHTGVRSKTWIANT